MDRIRYVLAVIVIVALPPAVLFWYFIHPFTAFWKRLGMAWTYVLVTIPCIGFAFWLWQYREPLTAVRYPFRWPLAAIGLLLYLFSIAFELRIKKQLKTRILVGAPELGGKPAPLLTEGPFSRTRNPRYLNILIAVVGLAFIVNYQMVYIFAVLMVPALYLVILLEERELKERFGIEYAEYLERVPRLWPRFSQTPGHNT